MKKIETTNRFLRDLKKAKKQHKNLPKLEKIVTILQKGESLPSSNQPHKLQGEYKDCWECHIEPDWLLIYLLSDKVLTLVRIGSHTELFE